MRKSTIKFYVNALIICVTGFFFREIVIVLKFIIVKCIWPVLRIFVILFFEILEFTVESIKKYLKKKRKK